MKELIKITEHKGEKVVSARELHQFLEVKTEFKDWILRMLDYGFEQDKDFSSFLSESTGGRPSKEFALTIDTAKEIAMIQRNEKGKEARRYFIEVEKLAKESYKPKTQIDLIIETAKIVREQELRLIKHEERLTELEAKTTTRPDYFTIAGYGNLNGMSVNITIASKLGREASKKCNQLGIETDETFDPRFGKVKMYPKNVLVDVFNSFRYS